MVLIMAAAAILGISAFFSLKVFILCIVSALLLALRSNVKNAILFFSVILLFFLISHIHAHFNQTRLSGNESRHIVRFIDVTSIDGASVQAIVKNSENEKLLLTYYFRTEKEKTDFKTMFRIGMVCAVPGSLETPSPNRNPGAFNYQKYLYSQNIHWILRSEKLPLQDCIADRPALVERIKSIRLNGLRKIEASYLPESKGFAAALLFGDSSMIEQPVYNAYKELSLVHILAISGLHVAALCAGLMFLLVRLGITRERAKLLLVILMPVYAVLAGGAPSVLRACVMVMIFLCLSLCKVRGSAMEILILVFLLLLAANPFYLQNSGFQLSFFITFGLLASRNILERMQMRGPLLQSLGLTVICQLCSMPIILFHFHQFSLYGFLLNIIYIPLFTVCLLPLTMISFFWSLLHLPFQPFFFNLMEFLFRWSSNAAEVASQLPFSSLSFAKPSLLFAMLLLCTILGLFYFWNTLSKKQIVRALVLCITLLFIHYNEQLWSPYGEIIFIDVGQGDSILIKQPFGGGVYLIDTGGILRFGEEEWQKRTNVFEPGEHIVVPFLKSKGIRSIDKLILTHDDQDHIGGAVAVLNGIDVKEIVIPEVLREEFRTTALVNEAVKQEIKVDMLKTGDGWEKRGDSFTVLHPDTHRGDSNESSLVLYARINGMKWLFTGDMGKESEAVLTREWPKLEVDYLKVGHHGSHTSSSADFIDTLSPKAAIISAGENNRYGHPHADVLETFDERGVSIFRTDKMGAVSYTYLFGRGTFTAELP